jgi:signal peptidase II
MADRTYRWLLISLAVIGLTADQVSKYGVFKWLYKGGQFADTSRTGNEYDVVPGWFKLISQFEPSTPTSSNPAVNGLQTWSAPEMPRVNHGALFGIGGGQKGLANGAFAAVSMAAAIAILVWGTRQSTARERGLTAALGLILGGTVGNLYDRLVFGGVRDFLYFYKVEWPVFNVADCCLVVGAGLLLVQAVFVTPEPEKPATPDDEPIIPEGPPNFRKGTSVEESA